MVTELTEVDGISESFADNFRDAGYYSAEDVANAEDADELTEVKRVGDSRANSIYEAANDVAEDSQDDSESFDLTEDEDDEEEKETDSEPDESVSEESGTVLEYEFDGKREYEWFKYVLQRGILDGRSNEQIRKVFNDIIESESNDYSISVELDNMQVNALKHHLSTTKREFLNKREQDLMNMVIDVLETL